MFSLNYSFVIVLVSCNFVFEIKTNDDLFFFLIEMVYCSSSSSILLNRLRKEKTIEFQSKFSSPIQINLQDKSRLQITCSFFSNFDLLDIFWLQNGTHIHSFISKVFFFSKKKTLFLIEMIFFFH